MKRTNISELPHLLKQARSSTKEGTSAYTASSTTNASFTRCTMCHTAVLARAGPLHAYCCYERFVERKVVLRYQIAQVESTMPFVMRLSVADPWPAAEAIMKCMRADSGAMVETERPRALHQSLFMRLMEFMLHSDTQGTQAAACSAVLHQSLTSVPGSWQPLQMSCIMDLIHRIAAAPSHQLVVISDALGIIHQAIRDAARLGIGPVILLTDAVCAAELYRQPLAAALNEFISWGSSGHALPLGTLSRDQVVVYSARGRACTAALQLVGCIGLILEEQGRLTRIRAAEVLAAAH
jgi:hypothetical protein